VTVPVAAPPVAEFAVKVAGRSLAGHEILDVLRIEVEQTLQAADMLTIVLADDRCEHLDSSTWTLGTAVKVSWRGPTGSAAVDVFEGEITAVEAQFQSNLGMQMVVRAFDKGHRLDHGTKTRVFTQATYSDIVNKIAGETSLTADVQTTSVVHPHVMQANESDGAFLRRLAREIGYDVRVSGASLQFKRPQRGSATTVLEWGTNLLELQALVRPSPATDAVTRGWDPKAKQVVESGSKPAAADGVQAGVEAPKPLTQKAFARATTFTGTATAYRNASQASAAATAAAEDLGSAYLELHGRALGDARIKAGAAVQLKGLGTKLSGTYVVTSVTHVHDPSDGGFSTAFSVTGRHDRSLLGLAGGGTQTAGGPFGAHVMPGLVVGIVTNIKDPEGQGRVKVKLPWLDDTLETDWVRPAQLLAGNGYGTSFLPELNTEVVLGFEHGDVNRPYMLGCLYNGKDKTKDPASELVATSGNVKKRTLESKDKHRLELWDTGGEKEGLSLRTGDDKYFVDIDKKGTKIVVSSDGTVEITAKRDITVKAQGNLKMEATQNVELKGQKVEIKGNTGVSVSSPAPVEIKSNAKIDVNAGGMLDLVSNGVTTVRGSLLKLN
jgi:phage protein D